MKSPCFEPFPNLETVRLNLRALTSQDAEAMHRLRSNREVMRLLDRPLTNSVSDAELKFHKIMASTNAQNAASIGLLEKNGFAREAFHRQHHFWNGRFIESIELARYSPAAELAMEDRIIDPVNDVHE